MNRFLLPRKSRGTSSAAQSPANGRSPCKTRRHTLFALSLTALAFAVNTPAAEESVKEKYPVGPNENPPKKISLPEKQVTLIKLSVEGKGPWEIVEKTASVKGTYDTEDDTSMKYTFDPMEPGAGFDVTFTGELTRPWSADGSGERPSYELQVSGRKRLYVVPDKARVPFGEDKTYDAKEGYNKETAGSVGVDSWTITGENTTISGGTAGLNSAADPEDDAKSYTVTAEKDDKEATAQFIPTAVESISAKGKTSTAEETETIYVAKDATVEFEATPKPGSEFPEDEPEWEVAGSDTQEETEDNTEKEVDGETCKVKFKKTGNYTVKARCGYDDDWEKMEVIAVEVNLDPVTSRSPSLEDKGRICLNAQDRYKKAKFEATVKPVGTKAHVESTSVLVNLKFSGINGADPNALQDGEKFWAEETGDHGFYGIRLQHNDCSDCKTSYTETVFRFAYILNTDTMPGITLSSSGNPAHDDGKVGSIGGRHDGGFAKLYWLTANDVDYVPGTGLGDKARDLDLPIIGEAKNYQEMGSGTGKNEVEFWAGLIESAKLEVGTLPIDFKGKMEFSCDVKYTADVHTHGYVKFGDRGYVMAKEK